MFRSALILAAACAAMIATPVAAKDYTVGTLKISQPWARATPKGAPVGGGYLTITNTGTSPDRFIGGSVDFAKRFEIHEMKMDNNVMKMRMLPNGLAIKPGETVTLKPGGYHIMFVGMQKPLVKGQNVEVTLRFEKAGEVKVDFPVAAIGAMKMGGNDMKGMSKPMKH
jgi:copper(I)-binding protein